MITINSLYHILSVPRANLFSNWKEILIIFGFILSAHVTSEFILPRLFPGLYFSLRPLPKKGIATSDSDLDAAAARDARNKIVSSAFSAYVSILSLRGLFFSPPGEAERLENDTFASTVESTHLMRVACAYFVWDVATLFNDFNDDVVVWLLHGGLCLWVFLTSLTPFLHHMGYVTLIFEISTPFLHLRKYLLQAKLTNTILFGYVQSLFGVLFILSRIVFGCYKMYGPNQWWWKMQSLLAESVDGNVQGVSKTTISTSIVYFYQICCVTLTLLNITWANTILRNRFKLNKTIKAL
jgi:hypothetical protein